MRIATAKTAKSKEWSNVNTTWDKLTERLSKPHISHLTFKEYKKLSPLKQGEIKDVGGYVGGYLKSGKRKVGHVEIRSLLTLDIDANPSDTLLDDIDKLGVKCLVHSTFKHTSEKPRYRIVIPLDNEVDAVMYEAIARGLADELGIEQFDRTTFQPHRLMYWPSHPKDGEFFVKLYDGSDLSTSKYLDSYLDYTDTSEWAMHADIDTHVLSDIKKQQDPRAKNGVVGTFCRTYDIHDAISEFLQDEYTPTADNNRYTYSKGESVAGLIVYQDTWAYSHHGTDPTSQKLCNAFDLVRIHKFGHEDINEADDKAPQSMPSYKRMSDLVMNDPTCKTTLLEDKKVLADDFDLSDVDDTVAVKKKTSNKAKAVDWQNKLTYDKAGNVEPTAINIELIIRNDEHLKGKFRTNEFEAKNCIVGEVYWYKERESEIQFKNDGSREMSDADYAGVRAHFDKYYGISNRLKIEDALMLEFSNNRVNPLKDYLESLPEWDGIDRVNNFLIDYYGAEDNDYSRFTIRKTLTGAVNRVYQPGCKFDYVLVLVGAQGVGKSQFGEKLCMYNKDWFHSNFGFSTKANTMEEAIEGKWIVEAAELAGHGKSENDTMKAFITRTKDHYRRAYARTKHTYHRQGIIVGTINDNEFLKDATGDRRYWPIKINRARIKKSIFDMPLEEVNQLWAQAKHYFKNGEKLYLTLEQEKLASVAQRAHTIRDAREGIIEEFIDTLLPDNWGDMRIFERRAYLNDDEMKGTNIRNEVCALEIYREALGKDDSNNSEIRQINTILRTLDSWEFVSKPKRFKNYGPQRYYRRKLTDGGN